MHVLQSSSATTIAQAIVLSLFCFVSSTTLPLPLSRFDSSVSMVIIPLAIVPIPSITTLPSFVLFCSQRRAISAASSSVTLAALQMMLESASPRHSGVNISVNDGASTLFLRSFADSWRVMYSVPSSAIYTSRPLIKALKISLGLSD